MPRGTAFITDLGMTGPYEGVIGAEPIAIIKRSKQGLPAKINPHQGRGQLNGLILEIDDNTNKVINIKRIMIRE